MKTLIIGNLGSGKTTLAEKIGKMYEIPFFSIDNIVHDDTKGVKRTNQEQIDIINNSILLTDDTTGETYKVGVDNGEVYSAREIG